VTEALLIRDFASSNVSLMMAILLVNLKLFLEPLQ